MTAKAIMHYVAFFSKTNSASSLPAKLGKGICNTFSQSAISLATQSAIVSFANAVKPLVFWAPAEMIVVPPTIACQLSVLHYSKCVDERYDFSILDVKSFPTTGYTSKSTSSSPPLFCFSHFSPSASIVSPIHKVLHSLCALSIAVTDSFFFGLLSKRRSMYVQYPFPLPTSNIVLPRVTC